MDPLCVGERWVDITEGFYLRTSNFICGLIYIGGFALWNRVLVIMLKRELAKKQNNQNNNKELHNPKVVDGFTAFCSHNKS